ncbi:MAG TPA: EscU/YscU/HrcU family type III secretion system export apparatus switch protein [Spirochaetota bacterium]|nr:EscU/YscU/HrcU family type III secretion system export apparatus switch protein [Spirochaetota bacterium]
MKKKAASISYLNENSEIPIISSIGEGEFAKKIIEKAKANGIKIVQDTNFFEFEKLFKPGKPIPEEVYNIVVEILITILKTNK